MIIAQLRKVTKANATDLANVVAQLRGKKVHTSVVRLQKAVNDKNTVMVVAKDRTRIVGVGTLYILEGIGKRVSVIEDLVIDSDYRRRGLGENITRTLIAVARKRKVMRVRLTSRSVHAEAHKLYHKLGFKIKDTTVFTMDI